MKRLCVVLGLLLLSGCAPTAHTTTLLAMDTVMELTVYGDGGAAELAECESCIRTLEGLFSVTDANSEIYAANHSGGQPVSLSPDTAALLKDALDLCADTDGALDITIYPVVRAWGFTTGEYRIPEAGELQELLQQVDYTKVALDDTSLCLPSNVELDLGAVAKGYTGDRLIALLRARGVTSALLELGGSVHTLGAKPDGSPWSIAIQSPDGAGYAGVLEVQDCAVVTSGGYQRYFEKDGETYWHILDPATGVPAHSGVRSVTIVAANGTRCDGLSTALFVMGPERAAAYWREHRDFDFVLIRDDGSFLVTAGIAEQFSPLDTWQTHDLEILS